jgi:hypothetical protein
MGLRVVGSEPRRVEKTIARALRFALDPTVERADAISELVAASGDDRHTLTIVHGRLERALAEQHSVVVARAAALVAAAAARATDVPHEAPPLHLVS